MGKVRSRLSDYAQKGTIAFLYGEFCALWAKNSRRNARVWFFLGALSPIAVLFLLYKNAQDFDQTAPA